MTYRWSQPLPSLVEPPNITLSNGIIISHPFIEQTSDLCFVYILIPIIYHGDSLRCLITGDGNLTTKQTSWLVPSNKWTQILKNHGLNSKENSLRMYIWICSNYAYCVFSCFFCIYAYLLKGSRLANFPTNLPNLWPSTHASVHEAAFSILAPGSEDLSAQVQGYHRSHLLPAWSFPTDLTICHFGFSSGREICGVVFSDAEALSWWRTARGFCTPFS